MLLTNMIYFRHMPGHASREVMIVFGSLTTCDPGDITETIKVSINILIYFLDPTIFNFCMFVM